MKKLSFTLTVMVLFCSVAFAADKVVVIPLNATPPDGSSDKVWGQGRPVTKTLSHNTSNGYCTTAAGIRFALSSHFSTWGSAASVCPKDTWVCEASEVASTRCDISLADTYNYESCGGTLNPDPAATITSVWGWLADAYGVNPLFSRFKYSDSEIVVYADYCSAMRVWCCWE